MEQHFDRVMKTQEKLDKILSFLHSKFDSPQNMKNWLKIYGMGEYTLIMDARNYRLAMRDKNIRIPTADYQIFDKIAGKDDTAKGKYDLGFLVNF